MGDYFDPSIEIMYHVKENFWFIEIIRLSLITISSLVTPPRSNKATLTALGIFRHGQT